MRGCPRRMAAMKTFLYSCCFFVCFVRYLIAQNFHPEDVQDSVVQIVIGTPAANGQQSPLPVGSGFFAGDGRTVVTAGHVYWGPGAAANERHKSGIFAYKVLPSGKKFIVQLTPSKVD